MVVEVGSVDDDGSYDAFKARVLKSRLDRRGFDRTVSVRYVNRFGDKLEFSFAGHRAVNGRTIQLDNNKLFDSPFIQSVRKSGVITMTDGHRELILDFPNAALTERDTR